MDQTNKMDQQPQKQEKKKLRKSDLWKSFLIWEFTSETCLSYERLMSLGFCHALVPILKRLYGDDKKKLGAALTRHMTFFNTEMHWGAMIPGMVASLEEQRANGEKISDETIQSLKVGLMGPLAGIGDTITQGLVKTVLLALCVDLALKGNLLGPILFTLLYVGYMVGVGGVSFFQGYRLGKNIFSKISDQRILAKVTDSLSILGLMVSGALVAKYVTIQTPFKITFGKTVIKLQSLLNQIMPGMLSMIAVVAAFYFLRKNVSVVKIMLCMAAIAAVLSLVGLL